MIGDFHFLRPEWVLGLVPAALLWFVLRSSTDASRSWLRFMDADLLEALTVDDVRNAGRLRPLTLLGVTWVLAFIALAGPTWTRVPAPFAEDEAAIVFVQKVTPEMQAMDVQPSRLERSVHKMADLQALRTDGATALIAYAGSAHRVMPLTTDARIIELFAADLDPSVMPVPGDAAGRAVEMAQAELERRGVAGTIVLFADYVSEDEFAALQRHRDEGGASVQILAMAAGPEVQPPAGSPPAPPLDVENLRGAARAAGGDVTTLTADDSDVRTILARAERSVRRGATSEASAWRDDGWFLVFPLLFLVALFFRRGGGLAVGSA